MGASCCRAELILGGDQLKYETDTLTPVRSYFEFRCEVLDWYMTCICIADSPVRKYIKYK